MADRQGSFTRSPRERPSRTRRLRSHQTGRSSRGQERAETGPGPAAGSGTRCSCVGNSTEAPRNSDTESPHGLLILVLDVPRPPSRGSRAPHGHVLAAAERGCSDHLRRGGQPLRARTQGNRQPRGGRSRTLVTLGGPRGHVLRGRRHRTPEGKRTATCLVPAPPAAAAAKRVL